MPKKITYNSTHNPNEKNLIMHGVIESFKETVLSDASWPERAESWPQNRHLDDYWRLLLAPWTLKSLSEEPKLPDIMALLSLAWIAQKPLPIMDPVDFLQRINPGNKPIIVDIGMGDAHALKEIKEREGFVTVGLGLHEINPVNAPFLDLLIYSPVPNGAWANRVFNYLRGKVALVCEAYGASTYAAGESNPIEASIFAGLLLAPGATAKLIVSSIPEEEEEQSPLGFASQRQRLVDFFKEHLGLEMTISRTYISSRLKPGTHCVDYHVEIKRNVDAIVTEKSLEELFALAKAYIGVCRVIPKNTQAGEFGEFGIRARTYTREQEEIQWEGKNLSQNILSRTVRFTGEKDENPTFTLRFTNDIMGDFIIRFSEYYLNNKQQPEWAIAVNKDKGAVVLTYIGIHPNRISALNQAKLELNIISPGLWTESHPHQFFSVKGIEKPPIALNSSFVERISNA